ncbi:hypothetical protein BCON_0119g00140 [Botryotinia convoluta]|uniref:Uncharacterized protein n=1 Tax=Botryotinia convoluta TaxID=54673 RepID=A0A4Z1I4K7_9HELO|nr:hypothetical protein BCON_0119g00140 [Botryotinia convoluta]
MSASGCVLGEWLTRLRFIELAINLRFAAATPETITGWLMVVVLAAIAQYPLVAEFTYSTMIGCCGNHYQEFQSFSRALQAVLSEICSQSDGNGGGSCGTRETSICHNLVLRDYPICIFIHRYKKARTRVVPAVPDDRPVGSE